VEVIVNRRQIRAVTDSAGAFVLDVSPSDSTLAFRRIGYRAILFAIRPSAPPTDTILVQLTASAVSLPEIIVSAEPGKPLRYAGTTKYDEVFHRRKLGLGTLIARERIEARLGAKTYQLLDGVAGIHVWNGPPMRIRIVRCSEPGSVTVFIDGVRQIPNAPPSNQGLGNSGSLYRPPAPMPEPSMEPEVEILSRVNPSDIEMIEVFRGPSQIPAEFHWDGCAVIAIWMR
jgi:outer membrane receptor protein involved in Fe transport